MRALGRQLRDIIRWRWSGLWLFLTGVWVGWHNTGRALLAVIAIWTGAYILLVIFTDLEIVRVSFFTDDKAGRPYSRTVSLSGLLGFYVQLWRCKRKLRATMRRMERTKGALGGHVGRSARSEPPEPS